MARDADDPVRITNNCVRQPQGAAFQVPRETVARMKGAEMMLGHFRELFNL
jgi:hypothetical protein